MTSVAAFVREAVFGFTPKPHIKRVPQSLRVPERCARFMFIYHTELSRAVS